MTKINHNLPALPVVEDDHADAKLIGLCRNLLDLHAEDHALERATLETLIQRNEIVQDLQRARADYKAHLARFFKSKWLGSFDKHMVNRRSALACGVLLNGGPLNGGPLNGGPLNGGQPS